MTTAPLIVDYNSLEHGTDGKTRVAVRDQTPNRNLVGYLLVEDAECYVNYRNSTGLDIPQIDYNAELKKLEQEIQKLKANERMSGF